MKILFIIKNMKTAKGGAERVLSQVANGLSAQGHNVSVLSCDPRKGKSYYPLDDNIKQISLAIGDAGKKAGFRETFARIQAMRTIFRVKKPDIVIAFMHSMFIPVSIAALGSGIPVIASEHIVPKHYRRKPVEFLMLLFSTLLVKKMTVLSEDVKRTYPKIIHPKMVVMPNPVREISALSPQPTSNQQTKTILNVGRLDAQKDQKTLIRAFSLLAKKHSSWQLKIIGEGELRPFLEGLVTELGLNGRVLLPGTTKEIDKEYEAADIFALPSKYESFGLATAEAMSHRLPVIGFSDCPGTNELITHNKNGLLVEKKDDEGDRNKNYAKALDQLMQDETLRHRLGQAAQKSVVQFQPDIIINKWDDLIRQCA